MTRSGRDHEEDMTVRKASRIRNYNTIIVLGLAFDVMTVPFLSGAQAQSATPGGAAAKAGAKKAKKWAFRSRNISRVNMRDESAGCQILNGHARIAVNSVKTAKPFHFSWLRHIDHKNRENNFSRSSFRLPILRNFCEVLHI